MFFTKHIKPLIKVSILLIPLLYVTFVYQRLLFDPPTTILEETIAYEIPPLITIYNSINKYNIFPLWDNTMSSGISSISHPMYPQTYPLVYPLMALFNNNFIFTMRVYFFIHLLIAAYSFFFLAVYLKIDRLAAALGTIAYMSTYFILIYVMMSALRPDLLIMAYLPALFLLFLKALIEKDVFFAVLSGAVFSLLIHAGSLHYSLIALILMMIFFSFYTVLTLIKEGCSKNKLFIFSKIMFVFLLFSFGFSAIKALPVAEFLQLSPRRALTLEVSEQGMDLAYFKEMLRYDFSEFFPISYGATKPLSSQKFIIWGFFAVIVLSLLKKSRIVLSLCLTIAASLLIVGAKTFPIDFYALLYNLVPGFKSMRSPMRFLVFDWFALPLLFAFGVDLLIRNKAKINLSNFKIRASSLFLIQKINILNTSITLIFIAGAVILTLQGQRVINHFPYPTYAVSWYDSLLKNIKKADPASYRIASDFAALPTSRSAFPFYLYTAAITDNFDSNINVYNDTRPYYYNFYHMSDFSADDATLNKQYKKWSILNIKYIVLPNQNPPKNNHFKDITKEAGLKYNIQPQGRIWEVLNTKERFSFVPNGLLYIGEGTTEDKYNVEDIRKIIFDDNFDLEKLTVFKGESPYLDDYRNVLKNFNALVLNNAKVKDTNNANKYISDYEKSGGEVIKGPKLKQLLNNKEPAKFKINSLVETPGTLEIKFDTEAGGFFIYSNTYYPGWEATLNGQSTTVYMADSIVKGVIVPDKGSYTLTLNYRPKFFYLGLVITSTSIIFTIFLFLYRKKKMNPLTHLKARVFGS